MIDLSLLLSPRAIAVIGASGDATKVSGRTLTYLRKYGYRGKVYVVNPKADEIRGYPCLHTVSSLPEGIEVAVILLPIGSLEATLEECAAHGIRLVVGVAGNSPPAEEPALQARLQMICRRSGMRMIGHNCVGFIVPLSGVTATISAELAHALPPPGSIALLTQSGALGNSLLQGFNANRLGLRAWVSTGNEVDLDVIHLTESFLNDPSTKIVALFVEGLKYGAHLMGLARLARSLGKAIVVRRAGKSDLGRRASASHTGKLAGGGRVWQGIAKQGNLIEVSSLDEMLDVLLVLDTFGVVASSKPTGVGVLTVSGGVGVIIADEAHCRGLELPDFAPATHEALSRILPPHISLNNPVDTSYISEEAFCQAAAEILSDPSIGTVILVFMSLLHDMSKLMQPLLELAEEAKALGKHVAIAPVVSSDPIGMAVIGQLRKAGLLALPSVERCVAALGLWNSAAYVTSEPLSPPVAVASQESRIALAAGIPEPAQRLCADVNEAVAFAEQYSYPLVLKVSSEDLPHKTEVGGVILGIRNRDELESAWVRLASSIAANAPHARVEGYLVQEMILDAVEMIVGCSRDPEFGPVLMFGWGGILAETIDDTTFVSLPASRAEIAQALAGLKVSKILDGVRGRPPADREAAIDAAMRLGQIFLSWPEIAEIDVNPLLVRSRGHGVVAPDILVIGSLVDSSADLANTLE